MPFPASARVAWWGTAWLRGEVVTDLAVDAILGDDATHRLFGLPSEDGPVGLAVALGALRSAGVATLGLALARGGRPGRLGGPADLNAAALDAGEAVVAPGHGLVPRREGAVLVWQWYDARPRPLTDVGEADRRLRGALMQTARDLAALDVAQWRPEVADELMDLRRVPKLDAPPGTPPAASSWPPGPCRPRASWSSRSTTTAGRSAWPRPSSAAPHSASSGRAARQALVAACSPEVWPPD